MPSQLFRRKPLSNLRSEIDSTSHGGSLAKSLGLVDLTCLGIAAVIGAGIFSTIGKAAAHGGPAVSVLFILTAIACLFSALCYAEFASRIPVSGSAYTYTYATFGELCAWLIGWNLVLEYAIGNSTIAFSWSDYFMNLVRGVGLDLPAWLTTDYFSCAKAASASVPTDNDRALVEVWNSAPQIGGLRVLLDLPALMINFLVTAIVLVGIKESKNASNLMVLLKIIVVFLVIGVGCFYVTPANWSPFAPNGVAGVLAGISSVFFTYIGFDAVSTTAEECKNAKRDLPLATILTLVICTILYVILSFILTGMVHYHELNVADPLALVFEKHELHWLAGIVSISAVIAITSVFLVFQIGQPRIFMSMARDGLLPRRFARIHPTYKTPAFATLVTCLTVAIPILTLNADIVLDLCSMGTLFAFMFVSAGILVLDATESGPVEATFRVPYINSRWVVPLLFLVYTVALHYLPAVHNALDLAYWSAAASDFLGSGHIETTRLPYGVFYLVFLAMAAASWSYRLSLIPVLGVLTNLYLIAGMGTTNWLFFLGWCAVGVVGYFSYGYWKSRLRNASLSKN